jgi:hypothetical protein
MHGWLAHQPGRQPFNARNNDGGYAVQVPAKPERGQAPGILGIRNRTVFSRSAEGLRFTIPEADVSGLSGRKFLASFTPTKGRSLQGGHCPRQPVGWVALTHPTAGSSSCLCLLPLCRSYASG